MSDAAKRVWELEAQLKSANDRTERAELLFDGIVDKLLEVTGKYASVCALAAARLEESESYRQQCLELKELRDAVASLGVLFGFGSETTVDQVPSLIRGQYEAIDRISRDLPHSVENQTWLMMDIRSRILHSLKTAGLWPATDVEPRTNIRTLPHVSKVSR